MEILKRLKNLINIEVNIGDNITIATKGSVDIQRKNGKIVINPDALDVNAQQELQRIIRLAPQEIGEIAEESAEREIESIERTKDIPRIEEILDFFRSKISEAHLDILEKSLYLRDSFERGESIEKRKRDLMKKYGRDGNTIANLCTAGYFDRGNYLREIYEEIKDDNQCRREFEEIIKTQPFSVFVSRTKTEGQVMNEIKTKLQKYKKYGIKFLDVRSIGTKNVEKAIKSIRKIEEEVEHIEYKTDSSDTKCVVRIDPNSVRGLEDSHNNENSPIRHHKELT